MYSFPDLEPVCCSMSSSNCCFLTSIQVSQEAGQVVWYRLFQNFPQFIVIHTLKGFGTVNKTEIDVFLELSCFFHDPVDVFISCLIWILVFYFSLEYFATFFNFLTPSTLFLYVVLLNSLARLSLYNSS